MRHLIKYQAVVLRRSQEWVVPAVCVLFGAALAMQAMLQNAHIA
ncbi:MAG: hypothetical protein R3C52_15510 [Hyphomonadaceae bacterium]